jgi:DNA-binding response OmpR family regulator
LVTHILLVQGDPAAGEDLDVPLRRAGHAVTTLADPRAVMPALRAHAVDLLLLAGMPPDSDGLPALATLRGAHPGLPIVALARRADAAEEVAALRAGADDYIALPVEPGLLLARLGAAVRRYQPVAPTPMLRAGDGTLDRGGLRFMAAGRPPTHLTPVEARLLECLMRAADTPVPRAALTGCVGCQDDRLDLYVHRLRAKIEGDPGRPAWIRSVPGGGYVFRSGPDRT